MISNFKLLIVLLLTVSVSLLAQEKKESAFLSDFLKTYNGATGKVTQLAEAIPQGKYDWRPAEGIRSVQESILHIAQANYFFLTFLGAEAPEGIDLQNFDKSGGSKEEVIAKFNKSVENTTAFLGNIDESVFDEKVDFFGNEMTKRQIILTIGEHAAEHLGGLIAYARSNDVVPPWSK